VNKSIALALFGLLIVARTATAAEVSITVSDPGGAAGRAAAPVSVAVDLEKLFGKAIDAWRLQLVEATAEKTAVPVQFEPSGSGASKGTLWWLMPPGPKGDRRFRLTLAAQNPPAAMKARVDPKRELVEVFEGGLPVLRYNHGTFPVREGIEVRYARGDYISPLFGLHGEVLTEDYPRDHPHHRAVSWSWPVTRWKDEVRDIWAVSGVWARPVEIRRAVGGVVLAVVDAVSLWKWSDKDPIVREEVLIRAFRQRGRCRFVDVQVHLTGLVDGVAIGGRPKAGYGGFTLRAAPGKKQQILAHVDPPQARPRRAWLDYSAEFAGGKGRTGITILEHVTNPDYPSELKQYSDLNCVMSAFPGDREVPLPVGKTLVLKYRLWIHSGSADEATPADVWAAYAAAPKVKLAD